MNEIPPSNDNDAAPSAPLRIDAEIPAPSHLPVLLDAVLATLAGIQPPLIVDCTLGLAGHAALLLAARPELRLIGLDRDAQNLREAANRLDPYADRVRLRQGSFAALREILAEMGAGPVGGLLADLGVSSNQLADPSRGLSFEVDGPLDMRLDPAAGRTAADLVNSLSEGELSDLLYIQSQERHSRKIAKRICQARRQGRLNSTLGLARLVCAAVGEHPDAHRGRLHPATRTFLALRMTVNHEIDALRCLLDQAPHCLSVGGRLGIISFHSAEDRLVKEDFKARDAAGLYRIVTRKPIVADELERRSNPRSRSAKLRVAERLAGA